MVDKDSRKNARTVQTSKYAKARVAKKLTYRALNEMGFGTSTIQSADKGKLPRSRSLRAAYLDALGLTEPKAKGAK